VRKLEVYLHSFLTYALEISDVIPSRKYLRNLKQFIIETVRQRFMVLRWVRQWSYFTSGFTSHNISCHPAAPLAQTVIQFFVTIHFAEDIR